MEKNILVTLKENYENELSSDLKGKDEKVLLNALTKKIKDLYSEYGQVDGEIKAREIANKVLIYHLAKPISDKSEKLSCKDKNFYEDLISEGHIKILESMSNRKIENSYFLDDKGIQIKENFVGYFSKKSIGALYDYNRKNRNSHLTPKQKKIETKIREFRQISNKDTSDKKIIDDVVSYFKDARTNTGKGYKMSIKNVEEVMNIGEIKYLSEPLGEDDDRTLADTLSVENLRGYYIDDDNDIKKAILQELKHRVKKSNEAWHKAGKPNRSKEINDVKTDIFKVYIIKSEHPDVDKEYGVNSYSDIAEKYDISESAVSQQKDTLNVTIINWLKEINNTHGVDCMDYLFRHHKEKKENKERK
ncbi:MAG: hypothetical protein SA378_03035 [Sedimentibacter sp.]|uniref:hypothetical protein n=1 Tax=Sedimentibacter sp. TaxID=1960295 RepID=UPI00298120D9|nr:hypothetical protein [Sedimentibacter sp.]MDW5299101.1 hypothetical protein [Sedimentibacter sp.]